MLPHRYTNTKDILLNATESVGIEVPVETFHPGLVQNPLKVPPVCSTITVPCIYTMVVNVDISKRGESGSDEACNRTITIGSIRLALGLVSSLAIYKPRFLSRGSVNRRKIYRTAKRVIPGREREKWG